MNRSGGKDYELVVADADGERTSRRLRPRADHLAVLVAGRWQGRLRLLRSKKPVIYVQNLVTGQRTMMSNEKGSNSAPAWSPDGSKLAWRCPRRRQ
jgi:TolB protein